MKINFFCFFLNQFFGFSWSIKNIITNQNASLHLVNPFISCKVQGNSFLYQNLLLNLKTGHHLGYSHTNWGSIVYSRQCPSYYTLSKTRNIIYTPILSTRIFQIFQIFKLKKFFFCSKINPTHFFPKLFPS
jgi:hypothetical protein